MREMDIKKFMRGILIRVAIVGAIIGFIILLQHIQIVKVRNDFFKALENQDVEQMDGLFSDDSNFVVQNENYRKIRYNNISHWINMDFGKVEVSFDSGLTSINYLAGQASFFYNATVEKDHLGEPNSLFGYMNIEREGLRYVVTSIYINDSANNGFTEYLFGGVRM